jgi:hypothetical protein
VGCNKEITKNKKNKYYCSGECWREDKFLSYISAWQAGSLDGSIKNGVSQTLKRYLIRKLEGKCSECQLDEWMGKPIVLEMEHIDGDSYNNHESNLTLLCPNCHSQTPTYKGKNVGKGRAYRRVRYKNGQSY